VDRSSNGGGIETKTEKKETTATFKPRIATAATAPLSRCHRSSQPLPPLLSTATTFNQVFQQPPPSTKYSSNCHRSSQSPPPQHHRERSPASPSAQPSEIIASGNSLSPHSRRSSFIFLLAERALCTLCMQEENNMHSNQLIN